MQLLHYFATLRAGKIILWCYLIWYLITAATMFDPSPSIWLNSLGISLVIGVALVLSVSGGVRLREDPWQTVRLFLMPFCVSSFASLIKGKEYILVFPGKTSVLVASISACIGFVVFIRLVRVFIR